MSGSHERAISALLNRHPKPGARRADKVVVSQLEFGNIPFQATAAPITAIKVHARKFSQKKTGSSAREHSKYPVGPFPRKTPSLRPLQASLKPRAMKKTPMKTRAMEAPLWFVMTWRKMAVTPCPIAAENAI